MFRLFRRHVTDEIAPAVGGLVQAMTERAELARTEETIITNETRAGTIPTWLEDALLPHHYAETEDHTQ